MSAKPIAKWHLTVLHPFIILIMTLGTLLFYQIENDIHNYLIVTLPIYLFITIIMYIPKIPTLLRLMLSLVAIFGYAFFMAVITPDDIKHVNKAIVFMTSIAPFLGYMLFIWAGYIRKPAKEESTKHHSDLCCTICRFLARLKKSLLIIFLSILASALQLPVAIGITMVVELFLMLFTWQL